jgi:rhamnosyltransferase subunit B
MARSHQNILITAFGSAGDVLPYIGIGAELRKRGHSVTLISNPYFASQAGEAGLRHAAIGTMADYQQLMTDPGLFHWKTASRRVDAHFNGIIGPVYQAMADLYIPGKTVVFASNPSSVPWIAVEKFGIPYIAGMVSPSRIHSKYDPSCPSRPLPLWAARIARTRHGLRLLYLLRNRFEKLSALKSSLQRPKAVPSSLKAFLDELNQARARIGLTALERNSTGREHAPQRIICMWPDWFAPRQKDWPAEAVLAGFPLFTPPADAVEDLQLVRRLDGIKPLVFTTGSVACQQKPFFKTAMEACQILKLPGLLVTPHTEEIPQTLPSNVTHTRYASFDEIFPRSALVVHHAGIGTVAQALAAGVPQIARPIMGEQFDVANRLQKLGVGGMIDREEVSPARLARAAKSLLNSKVVLERCAYWQGRIDRRCSLIKAADLVESLSN